MTPFSVDATGSFDPDFCKPALKGELQQPCADSSLKYTWSCTVPSTGGVCRRSVDDAALALGDQPTAVVDLPSLLSTLTDIVVTITVSKGPRSSSYSVGIVLTKERALRVTIGVIKSSKDRLLLRVAEPSPPVVAKCRWTLSEGNIPAHTIDYGLAPYNDPDFARAGWEAQTFSLMLQTRSASTVLLPGATYRVTLTCTSEGLAGQSSHSWRMRIPPWGGTCQVSPKIAIALTDTVTFTCNTWSAEDLPIYYSFGFGANELLATESDISFTVPGLASVSSFKLPQGNYTAVARVLDSSGTWSTSFPENLTVKPVVPAAGQSEESVVMSCVNDLASLAQSSALLTASDSIVATMMNDAGSCGTGTSTTACAPSSRRLLASSAAYRMRVRALLLSKMARGSVAADMSPESAPRTLQSVRKLANAPREVVRPEAAESVMQLTLSGSANSMSDQLRNGGFASMMDMCQDAMVMADYMPDGTSRDKIILETKESLQNSVAVYVSAMTPDEKIFTATFPDTGILVKRQRAGAEIYISPPFYGAMVTYSHGHIDLSVQNPASGSSGSRRQQWNDGPGVYLTYFSRPWKPLNASLDMSDVVGASLFTSAGSLTPPLPSAFELHAPRKCAIPGCLRVWVRFLKISEGSLSPQNSTAKDLLMFAKGLRCLQWGSNAAWWTHTCTLVDLSYTPADNALRVQCLCDQDGFVYVDWTRPPMPRIHLNQLLLRYKRSYKQQPLIYVGVAGAAGALLLALVYILWIRYVLLQGMHFFGMFDERQMHTWATDPRVCALEGKWSAMTAHNSGTNDTKTIDLRESYNLSKLHTHAGLLHTKARRQSTTYWPSESRSSHGRPTYCWKDGGSSGGGSSSRNSGDMGPIVNGSSLLESQGAVNPFPESIK
jgi:hypothetical protein